MPSKVHCFISRVLLGGFLYFFSFFFFFSFLFLLFFSFQFLSVSRQKVRNIVVRFFKRGFAACGKCVGGVTVSFVQSALVPREERDKLFQVGKVVIDITGVKIP